MPATVGETRAWLSASYGVPHAPSTHYIIVADSADGIRIMTCCDGADEAGRLLSVAAGLIGGEMPPAPESGSVIVSRDDLRAILADAWAFTGDPAAFNRCAVAAGILDPPEASTGPSGPT